MEPVDGSLASIGHWWFPTYTGGAMSYIDSMGLSTFIALCDRLANQGRAANRLSDRLRGRTEEDEHIDPATAWPRRVELSNRR